jgi:RNA polymerase sigma-70 factor, ECF subfamily
MVGHDDAMEDAALVRRIAAGDASAETALVTRLFPRVRAFAMRRLRDRAAASDLAQQVIIGVLEAVRGGRVEQPERLAAFVMGTCRNTLLSSEKGERRRRELLDQFAPTFADVAEMTTDRMDTTKLTGCLEALDTRARTIIVLSYYADLDCDAIGRELAMAAGTVRVARHRALKALHDCVTGGVG